MTADLRLVADAAQRDADVFAPERVGDRLAERRLTDAGWSHEGEDDTGTAAVHRDQAALRLEFPHGEVFEDSILDVFETVVIVVQDSFGFEDVQSIVGLDAPGEFEDGVEPGADPAGLGTLVVRAIEFVDLSQYRGANVIG